MPPIVINVPSAAGGLPGWVTPLVGFVGVLVGLIGNNLLTRAQEQRQFRRDKKFELYLELQNSEYEIRRWLALREPVAPDFLDKNARWASLQLRMAMFASPEIEDLGNQFWNGLHQWLLNAREATLHGTPNEAERANLTEEADGLLRIHGKLYNAIRNDLRTSTWRDRRQHRK